MKNITISQFQNINKKLNILDITYFLDNNEFGNFNKFKLSNLNKSQNNGRVVDDNKVIPESTYEKYPKTQLNNEKNIIIKQDVKKDLSSMVSLNDVRAYLEKFDECKLKKTAINTVFGDGNPNAQIMIIGEAPGAEEDETGRPFVGRSGILLKKAFESISINLDNSFITNSVFWRPPGNRNPTEEEMMLCLPFLHKMISIINPKVLILVGAKATNNFLKNNLSISQIREQWHNMDVTVDDKKIHLNVKAVFHPAFLLRNPKQKRFLWYDILDIQNKCKELNIL